MLSVGLRAAALAAIGDPIHVGLALIAAHAASRGALPPMMLLLRAGPRRRARRRGRPPEPRRSRSPRPLIGGVIALATLGPSAGVARVAAGRRRASRSPAMLARRQIGGYTGDVLGFFQQIGEIVMLLVAAAR